MDKHNELATYLAAKGILDVAKQNDEIAKMAATLPPATAADKGLTTDVDKAYEVMLIEQGKASASTPAPTETSGVIEATRPAPTMSTEDENSIAKSLMEQKAQRIQVTSHTKIDQLIFDSPAASDYITAGTTGLINSKSIEAIKKDLADGKYEIIADGDADSEDIKSTSNWNQLLQAYNNSTPVAVHLAGLSQRVIGAIVQKGSATGSEKAEAMTTQDLLNWLTVYGYGYILASENTAGAKLRWTKARNKESSSQMGAVTPGKTVLAITHKKGAVEAGSYDISKEVDPAGTKRKATMKSELAFKVRMLGDSSNAKKLDGSQKILTKRVSVQVEIPVLQRKAQYRDTFPEKAGNSDLLEAPVGKQLVDIQKAQRQAMFDILRKANSADSMEEVDKYRNVIEEFSQKKQTAQTAPANF